MMKHTKKAIVLTAIALALPATGLFAAPSQASVAYLPEGPGTVDEIVLDADATMGWCCDWCRSVIERNCPNGGYGRCSQPDANRCRCTYWCYTTAATTNVVEL